MIIDIVSCKSMFELAQQHQWRHISHLIEKDPSNLLSRDNTGETLLHFMIKCFSSIHSNAQLSEDGPIYDLFQCILTALNTAAGVRATLIPPRHGLTPLHVCCQNIVPEKVTEHVARSNPRAISIQDYEGHTPLNKALRCGATDQLLEFLIDLAIQETEAQDCCINKFDVDGNLPLHTAMYEGSCQIVKLLLDIFPQGILSLNHYHQSPLHLASEFERFDLIRVFLESHACLSIDCLDTLLRIEDHRGKTTLTP